MNRSCIIIMGPTGVGKTDFVENITIPQSFEIINGDMGQLYRQLTIGTAKPNLNEVVVPHHLFDVVHDPINISVVDYRNLVIESCKFIWSRNSLPIIVGGSGFYLKSLLFPPIDLNNLIIKNESYNDLIINNTWQDLFKIDPERAQEIHHNDLYRINRAIAITRATGSTNKNFKPILNLFVDNVFLIWVTREKEDLYARINNRVNCMMQYGLLNEVRQLLGTPWEEFLLKKKIIAYDDCINYLRNFELLNLNNNNCEYDNIINSIQQKTRNYAKRQEIFWKSFKKQIIYSSSNSLSSSINIAEIMVNDTISLDFLSQYITNYLNKEQRK